MRTIFALLGLLLVALLPRTAVSQTNTHTFFVDGLCGMCETRIETAVLDIDEVAAAEWDVDTRMLTVTLTDATFDAGRLHQAVAAVGHDTEQVKAKDSVYNQLHGCCKYRDPEQIAAHRGAAKTVEFFVDGLCGMCETRIEDAVLTIDEVAAAEWDVGTRMLTVTLTDAAFDAGRLHQAVAAVGHDTEQVKAKDSVYNQLHGCCKYRDPEQIAAHRSPAANTTTLFVDGLCRMCQDRIESASRTVPGVTSADWDIASRILTVGYEGETFDVSNVHRAVAAAGHDTKGLQATDAAYAGLSDCCKYRNPDVAKGYRPVMQYGKALTGRIRVEENGTPVPLPGVNLRWLNYDSGTVTDAEGRFTLDRPAGAERLIASYVGYYTDTLTLTDEASVDLTLTPGNTLETVDVTYRRKSIEVSFLEPMLIQQIGKSELLKAACCTLAESFETNPAVDVSFTDAVTGARQIEMLGLAGPYVQITRENLPDVRGLAAIYGLVYLPGPWVEGIQLSKGTGSVISGYEGMTGQINVELKKPDEGERLYVNLYGNTGQRWEANLNTRVPVGDNWHTGVLLHGNWQTRQNDRNQDGFVDMPTGRAWTFVNRWRYRNENGWNSQFGIKMSDFDKTSGQAAFTDNTAAGPAWGARIQTRRVEGWAKLGKIFQDRPAGSMGLQLAGSMHDQNASFGGNRYDADQYSFYANLLYRDEIGGPAHTLNAGLSLQWDAFDEWLGERLLVRRETVPGAYAEYTFAPNAKFTAVAGLRADDHNQYGFFLTPRMHLRYALSERSVLRMTAGSGRRTASLIAENLGMLASSRSVNIVANDPNNHPYGLDQEIAWNVGLNLRQTFVVKDREMILTLDGYHTRFEQQVVVDYDHSPREVRFYNLEGRSFSNTFQAQLDYALLRDFDLRLAYRFNDVQTDYAQGQLERPFVARHRAFVNLGYHTTTDWAFDLTINWQGSKRIPSTAANPVAFQFADRSPDFVVVNAQVSKTWHDNFDVYLGSENLLDFVQENPIIAADDPFGPYFDSSLVWGPIFGRMLYAGVRYTLD